MRSSILVALTLACVLGYSNAIFGLTSRKFYVGGSFKSVTNGSTTATVSGVAAFNGAFWDNLMGGVSNANGDVTGVTVNVVHVDSLYNVYVGGVFTYVGGVNTGPVAVFKRGASNWAPIGGSVLTYSTGYTQAGQGVYAIRSDCATANSNGCDLFIGGLFQFTASDATASNVAKYSSGSSVWLALGGTGSGPTGSNTYATTHGLSSTTTSHRVLAIWKKEASCSASVIGSTAGVACNIWIGGPFSQLIKVYSTKTSLWTQPSSTQVLTSGSRLLPSANTFMVNSIFYQSYLFLNDEVYIGGVFDFLDDSGNNRCAYVCKVQITNSNAATGATFTFSAISASSTTGPTGSSFTSNQVKSVSTYYNSYSDYAKVSGTPTTQVYVAGTFTNPAVSGIANVAMTKDQQSWVSISSTDLTDIATNMTLVNGIWTCSQVAIDCNGAGSILVGGAGGTGISTVGYVRYYNAKDGSWNTLGGPLGQGAVLSVDSAVTSAGSKSVNLNNCVAIVFLAMLFITLF